jgi:hypothetical protein
MNEKIKRLIKLLDWPSGSVLGTHTLTMIALSVYLQVHGKDFQASILDFYKFVLINFSVVKGAKLGIAAFGKAETGEQK